MNRWSGAVAQIFNLNVPPVSATCETPSIWAAIKGVGATQYFLPITLRFSRQILRLGHMILSRLIYISRYPDQGCTRMFGYLSKLLSRCLD